jgi:hypothetical protein
LKGTTVSGTWHVIPGSGTGDLMGLRGEGGFTAELGQHADIHLDYWIERQPGKRSSIQPTPSLG